MSRFSLRSRQCRRAPVHVVRRIYAHIYHIPPHPRTCISSALNSSIEMLEKAFWYRPSPTSSSQDSSTLVTIVFEAYLCSRPYSGATSYIYISCPSVEEYYRPHWPESTGAEPPGRNLPGQPIGQPSLPQAVGQIPHGDFSTSFYSWRYKESRMEGIRK